MHQWKNEIHNKYQFRNTEFIYIYIYIYIYETKQNIKKTNSYGYTNLMEAKRSEKKNVIVHI